MPAVSARSVTRGALVLTLFGPRPAGVANGERVTGPSRWKENTMGVIKSLWASVQGNPAFMRRVNGWLTVFWIGMIPVSIIAGFLSSVSYVSALSLWALVSGHWSAWQAARVEVEQMAEADDLQSHPIEKRVVEEIIDQTNVLRSEQSALAADYSSAPQPNDPWWPRRSSGAHRSSDR
jgi:hypothetical protein